MHKNNRCLLFLQVFIQSTIRQYEYCDYSYNVPHDEITWREDNIQESETYDCHSPQILSALKQNTGGFESKNRNKLLSFFLLFLCFGFGSAADLIKLSNCSLPLMHCPTSKDYGFRELCINIRTGVCPEGSTYVCGIDREKRYIIETCQEIKECWPGKYLFVGCC